jgi:hypothetical protein
VDSLALGPGEEAIFEVRTSRKESTSLEDTIEREYESTLEQTSQDSNTQTTTDQLQTNQSGTSSTSLTPTAEVPIPVGDVAKVDASLSANASHTFTDNLNNSTQNSVTIATQNSRRASSKLRQNHRVTLKTGIETGIETLSRRIIKNPNTATPITLHYFKVMQKVEMQQERTGVRLCWAPFVFDPGGPLRTQMRTASHLVLFEARRSVETPPEPLPPKKEMAPFWKESTRVISCTGFMGGVLTDVFDLKVKIGTGETYTGRADVVSSGTAADRTTVKLYGDIPEAPDADGYVLVGVGVFSDVNFLRHGDSLRVTLRVEVLRQLPGYDEKQLEYQRLLDEHRKEVTQLRTAAAAAAKPAADAAAANILGTADIRAELIASVVSQYIRLMESREASQIDLWHRIVDFDNVSYNLYPGWWRDYPLPSPGLSAHHFLNARMARVFLPVREGYEEQFTELLYLPRRPATRGRVTTQRYRDLLMGFITDLRTEQKNYRDKNNVPLVKAIGPVWTEYVPTNGTHVEAELSATTAADLVTERQIEATAARLEADIATITEENKIRQLASTPATPQVVVGRIT